MNIVGVDLGGTQLRAGRLAHIGLGPVTTARVPAEGSAEVVLAALTALIDPIAKSGLDAIGVGVPSLVDPGSGIVRAVPSIPSWQDVPLKKLLEERYNKPVHIANDASCFVTGEQRFGAARNRTEVVGLTLGTGTGAGIILGGRLHTGKSGGAGELGMLPYLDHTYEHYTSGQFFEAEHDTTGEALSAQAHARDPLALAIFADLGFHIGRLIHAVLFTLDPELIVLGGSVSRAYPYFHDAMMGSVAEFPYPSSVERLEILTAELEYPGVAGAALLAEAALSTRR